MPLGPLPYQPPQARLRPGMITAVAVLSIVISALSILANAGDILAGALMLVFSNVIAPIPATAPTTSSAATMPSPASLFAIGKTSLLLKAAGGLLSLVAAGVLLAAGIQMIRNRRNGIRLHWIFIAIKLPVTVLVAVATYLFTATMFRNVPVNTAAGPNAMALMMIAQVSAGLIVSLAYPITLVFLLRSQTAKNYLALLTE